MSSTDCTVRPVAPLTRVTRRGFVLLEAVVALAIIGIFAVGLLAATGVQVRASSKAQVLLTARALAEDRLMSVRMLEYDDLGKLPDSLKAGTFADPFTDYSWMTTVSPVKDEYDLFDVQIVISAHGEDYPLRTLVHEPRPAAQAGSF
jgi:prepilin-type N-terminal cleavage/methylation domain-containing protein